MAKMADLVAENEVLKRQLAALKEGAAVDVPAQALLEIQSLKTSLEQKEKDVTSLSDKIALLEKKAAETPSLDTGKNCVILDGNVWEIVHRETVKQLVEDFKRRLVEEDATAVVISKRGG